MGHSLVGRRVLQNPRGFGSPGLLGLLFLIDVKTLSLCGVSGLGRDCKFWFLFLLLCLYV